MGLGHSPSIVRDGLVLYLDAANPKSYPGSGTTWFDLKATSNSTLSNGPTFVNSNKGYFSFDGVNDYTQITVPTTTGTIGFWYYYNGTNVQKLIMGNSSSMLYQGGSAGTIHWFNNSTYAFAINIGSTANWFYITLTYSSTSNNNIYVNGILKYSSTSIVINKGNGVYNVAGNHYAPQNCRFGMIKTYDRELSADEIKQNFEATRGRYGV